MYNNYDNQNNAFAEIPVTEVETEEDSSSWSNGALSIGDETRFTSNKTKKESVDLLGERRCRKLFAFSIIVFAPPWRFQFASPFSRRMETRSSINLVVF